VVVNVDEGTIKENSDMSLEMRRSSVTNFLDVAKIPEIPNECANLFKKICRRVRFQLELHDVQR
jgi:hypothetical protein